MIPYDRTKLNFAQSQITHLEDNEDNHKFKKILAGFCLLILLLITVKGATAIPWGEQKVIAKELGYKNNFYGDFRYAYYETNGEDLARIYLRDIKKPKDAIVTFYKSCEDLSRDEFKCVVLHELGHFNDVVVKHTPILNHAFTPLSEAYANNYMQLKNPNCTIRWSE